MYCKSLQRSEVSSIHQVVCCACVTCFMNNLLVYTYVFDNLNLCPYSNLLVQVINISTANLTNYYNIIFISLKAVKNIALTDLSTLVIEAVSIWKDGKIWGKLEYQVSLIHRAAKLKNKRWIFLFEKKKREIIRALTFFVLNIFLKCMGHT